MKEQVHNIPGCQAQYNIVWLLHWIQSEKLDKNICVIAKLLHDQQKATKTRECSYLEVAECILNATSHATGSTVTSIEDVNITKHWVLLHHV